MALIENERRLSAVWGDSLAAPEEAALSRAAAFVRKGDEAGGVALCCSENLSGWAQGISPQVLPDLAIAYRAGRDEKNVVAAKAVFSWQLQRLTNGNGIVAPEDPLAIPHMLGDTECPGWLGTLPVFLEAECFDDNLFLTIMDLVRRLLNHLETRLYPARNIRMTQMDALMTSGLRLDFLPDADHWRDVGLRGLNDCFHRQFNPDGSSIEATGWYHYIVANMAWRFLKLKRAMPELGLQVTDEQVAWAFDYTAAMIAPDGTFNRIGDSTATVHPHQTLADFLNHRDRIFRDLGRDAALPPCRQFFPDAGQVLLRERWNAESVYITFDATRRKGFHWHPACNALQLQVGAHRLIADPGRMRYDPTPHRRMAVSTRAHSTVNLNGWDQSDAGGDLTFKEAEGFTVVTGLYDGGYWPIKEYEHGDGVYASHHRTLLWIHGDCLMVIDNVHHTGGQGQKPDVEINWQFGPGRLALEREARRLISHQGEAGLLMLWARCPQTTQWHLHEGEADPCLGWIADRADRPVPSPLMRIVLPQHDPWRTELVTVIFPFTGGRIPDVELETPEEAQKGPNHRIVLRRGDGSRDTVLWTPRLEAALGCTHSIQTDAALVCLHSPPGRTAPVSARVYEGTYLEPLQPPGPRMRRTYSIASPEVS